MTKKFVIVNPASASGSTMKRWPHLAEELERVSGKFEYDFTNATGVATLLAHEAVKAGFEEIVAVGGDGTVNEVLQGLFENGELINPEVILSTIPSGTGVDFAKSLKVPLDHAALFKNYKKSKVEKIDIGEASFVNHRGEKTTRFFLNMADVGLGGEVVERANNSSKILGGLGTYFVSSLVSFAKFKPKVVSIEAEGYKYDGKITSIFIGNGEYYGGGMHIAPGARFDDGLLNVVVLKEVPLKELLFVIGKLYSGKLAGLDFVDSFLTSNLKVETEGLALISTDGEQPGKAPAEFMVREKAIKFRI